MPLGQRQMIVQKTRNLQKQTENNNNTNNLDVESILGDEIGFIDMKNYNLLSSVAKNIEYGDLERAGIYNNNNKNEIFDLIDQLKVQCIKNIFNEFNRYKKVSGGKSCKRKLIKNKKTKRNK